MTKLKIRLISSVISILINQLFFSFNNAPCYAEIPISNSGRNRVDGTTGTPLGGVGTGTVKYCAWTGILNAFTDMTPAGMQGYNKHITLGRNSSFLFFSNRSGKKVTMDPLKVPNVNGHFDDDAIFPIHKANFGDINNVLVSMVGFCPWDLSNFDRMCLPYAFYEFTLTNRQSKSVEVAVALKIKYETIPIFVPGKGLKDDSGIHRKAVFVKSDYVNSIITSGSDTGFFTNGRCNNVIGDTTNIVALNILLGAKETKTIKFVHAWYKVNSYGKYYYENLVADAGSVADTGLTHFNTFKKNSITFVTKMRDSNLPVWMTNYLLNTLCNMVNNSVYSKDGRTCMAEGQFNTLGTIDEYWQGRSIIGSNLMPEFTWKELEYWGKTQYRDHFLGQIHHDFGKGTSDDLPDRDDYNHPDVVPMENVISWTDTNIGFIIGAYETFIATDDHKKLTSLWPYLKNTGLRLITQKGHLLYGDRQYPWTYKTSRNMYDAGGYCQTYSTGTVIPAYKCMAFMAEVMDEQETKQLFDSAAAVTYKNFEAKYLASDFIYLEKHCENALGGPWFSQCLKFDQFDQVKVDKYLFDALKRYYKPVTDSMGFPHGTYDEWPQHIVGHFGGYALQRSEFDVAIALWKDMYNRSYIDRNRVFNLPISMQSKASANYAATNIDGYLQYTSRTSTWRIYQDIIGYYRNKHTGEIWLEPVILPEMNHELIDGFIISAEGKGTICCKEKGIFFEDRTITFTPDNPIYVNNICLKDSPGFPVVTVNGVKQTWIRAGPAWKKRIMIHWSGIVDKKGIIVDVKS